MSLSQHKLRAIQKCLLDQKSSILNKTSEFRKLQADRETFGDEADLASAGLEENVSIHLHERDRRTLLFIENALGKIANGTYGQCESCGCEIQERRLEVHPFSNHCVECMEEHESRPLS